MIGVDFVNGSFAGETLGTHPRRSRAFAPGRICGPEGSAIYCSPYLTAERATAVGRPAGSVPIATDQGRRGSGRCEPAHESVRP